MDEEKRLLAYLKDIQKWSSYPIVVEDPKKQHCFVKSGGTKQDVYHHMVLIRERINFIIDYFFEEEAEDGQ